MKIKVLASVIVLGVLMGCNNSIDCSKTTFDETNKLTFLNNKPFNGACNSYYMNGKLESVRNYKNGLDHGEWMYKYLNGNIEMTGLFENGERVGQWEYFHPNGTLKQVSFYTNGLSSGVWKMYDEDGVEINEINYNKN